MRIPLATLLALLTLTALVLVPASAQAMDDNGTDACLPKPGFPGIGTDSDGFCDPLEESGGGGGEGGGGGGEGAGGGGGTGSGDGGLPPEVVVVEDWGPAPSEPAPPPQSDPPPRGSGPEFGFPEPPKRGGGAPRPEKPDPRKECLELEEKGKFRPSLKFGTPSAPERDWVEKKKAEIEHQKFVVEQALLTLMSVELAESKWEVEPRKKALKRHREKLGALYQSLYAVLEARDKWREKKCAAVLSPKT